MNWKINDLIWKSHLPGANESIALLCFQVSLEVAGSLASLSQPSTTTAGQTSTPVEQPEVLSAEVADSVASMVASLSPGTSRSMVDTLLEDTASNQKDNNYNDFFSSLELQKAPMKEERLDHHKALRIANILNDLAFSSDSEDFFPEEEEGSDKESEGAKRHPPKSHTGGKWGPSLGKGAGGGKWKPSGKLEAMRAAKEKAGAGKTVNQRRPAARLRGKRLPMLDDNSEEEEEEENEEEVAEVRGHGKGKSIPEMARLMGAVNVPSSKVARVEAGGAAVSEMPADGAVAVEGTYFCRVCNRTLNSQSGYERHLATAYHRKHVEQQEAGPPTEPQLNEDEPIECTICLKSFNYKYNFARHLASAYHLRRARMCSTSLLLDESCQILLLRQSRFQCLVCSFFTSQQDYLIQHLRQPAHASRCARLIGPLLCVRCKFRTPSNTSLLQHLVSAEHQRVISAARRPCIIKESRNNLHCEQCNITIHSATAMVQHNKVHHGKDGNKPMRRLRAAKPSCPYCGSEWQSLFQLAIHIRRKHTKEKPFECQPCGKAFADNNSLKSHLQTALHQKRSQKPDKPVKASRPRRTRPRVAADNNLVKCKHCDYKVVRYRDLREHYLECHANEMITCEPCGANFVSYHLYTIHTLSKRHQAKLQLQDSQEVLRCQFCKAIFPSKQKLVLHEMAHNSNDLTSEMADTHKPEKLLVGVNAKYHEFVASIREKPPSTLITCPECSRQMTMSNVIPHLRKHGGNAPYQCVMCVKTFYRSQRLQQHLQHHLEVREHQCKICKKAFYRSHHLRYHMETQHPRDDHEVFVCSICSQQFVSKLQCQLHERKHDKPFKCHFEACRFTFHSRIDLESHINTHTNVRPFLCDECGYTAKSKRQLGYHRKNHLGIRNHLCDYCQYRGSTKAHLQRHMRIHVGAKPYKCPYCSYCCSTLDNLGKHIQKTSKHRGLPMYPCSQCSFGTNHSKDFRNHLHSHHGVTDSQMGTLSAYIGLYRADQDPKEVPEGGLALPVRERKTKGTVIKQEIIEIIEPEEPVPVTLPESGNDEMIGNPGVGEQVATEPPAVRESEVVTEVTAPDTPSESIKPVLSTLQPVSVCFTEEPQAVPLSDLAVSAPELVSRLSSNPNEVQLIWYSDDLQPLQFISEDPQAPSDVASCVEVTMASGWDRH